jgi:hypothetical protein
MTAGWSSRARERFRGHPRADLELVGQRPSHLATKVRVIVDRSNLGFEITRVQ